MAVSLASSAEQKDWSKKWNNPVGVFVFKTSIKYDNIQLLSAYGKPHQKN